MMVMSIDLKITQQHQMAFSKASVDPIDFFPEEIALEIFSHIDTLSSLGRCCLVSKKWQQIANDISLWKAIHPPNI